MTKLKLLSLLLALVLALGCAGALAEDDLQAQLDTANARIAELEAQVETYYPYYISQIVAEFANGTVVPLSEVQEQYDMVNNQYTQSYGINLEQLGMGDTLKRDLVDTAVEQAVLLAKATELGLDQFDEETLSQFESDAQAQLDQYIQSFIDYYYADQEVTDDMRTQIVTYLSDNGMDAATLAEGLKRSAALDAVREHAVKDVTVSDEDVQAAYDALVAANTENYANDSAYNADRNAGVTIAWNPEGYRAVKQVLIQFSDEQQSRYNELQDQLKSLNTERDAIENPAEDADTSAQRPLAEVDGDIAACGMEVEKLYTELLPEANEVIDAFNGGADFDSLIEQYNDDPGMKNEPTASMGYAVCEGSTTWDPTFTAGAMAIEQPGGISEPLYGNYGIYVIYYMDDIQPGAVPLEDIREGIEANALAEKQQSAYDEQLAAWIDEAGVTYHYDSFGIAAQ